jgi:uncharacterized protein
MPVTETAVAVSFRFYGSLNDFLGQERRSVRFTVALNAPASVKDTVEAIGVPHPEVDVILVGGTPVTFDYVLRDADIVSVYPRFRTLDLHGVVRVGTRPAEPVRFATDIHLGKLTSLLRLAGFDVLIYSDDAPLAEAGGDAGRIVLTRDRGVLKRRVVRSGYWVRHTDPPAQFVEVLDEFELGGCTAPFTRCIRCNGLLVPVEKPRIQDRLLPETRKHFDEFFQCRICERIYWRGSHYERLRKQLERLNVIQPARKPDPT